MSLENQQSERVRRRRSEFEGDDADLTELAAPEPVAEDDSQRDTYEAAEERLGGSPSARNQDQDGDLELTELAVPGPVSHHDSRDEEVTPPQSRTRLQHEESPDTHNSATTCVEEDETEPRSKASLAYAELCTVSWIVFFAILGTLARLGTQAISIYPNSPFPSTVLWANLGGSFFLGFLLEDRRLFWYSVENKIEEKDNNEEIDRVKKTLPLYIGLATGFCGSFTSFSNFITDAFLALTNALSSPSPPSPFHFVTADNIHARNGGYSFMAVVGVLIIQVSVSLASLKTGGHVAVATEKIIPSLPVAVLHRYVDPLSIPLGWGCWLGAVFLTIWQPSDDWRARASFSALFAPPGALLRFYLSKHLNGRIAAFPLGTFIVNIFGTIIEGMAMDLQHSSVLMASVSGPNAVPCAVLQGIEGGFCGSATTVSTWVAELNGLRRRHAWLYGLASVGLALSFQVVIMGSLGWTKGSDQHCAVRATQ